MKMPVEELVTKYDIGFRFPSDEGGMLVTGRMYQAMEDGAENAIHRRRKSIKAFLRQKKEDETQRYIVVDMPVGDGDRYQEVYATSEEANTAAEYQWHMLTPQERRRRHIIAGVVTKAMLPADAIDEETGVVDWSLFTDFDAFSGAFDSDTVEVKEDT